MARSEEVQLTAGSVNKASAGNQTILLPSEMRATSGTGEALSLEALEEARSLLLVLDITAVSGTDPTLDVAVYSQFEPWFLRIVQWDQQTGVTRLAYQIKRDGENRVVSPELLDAVPEPDAEDEYQQEDGVPWTGQLVVAYRIDGTFAPSDPGPPPVAGEGVTFSVSAFPIHF